MKERVVSHKYLCSTLALGIKGFQALEENEVLCPA